MNQTQVRDNRPTVVFWFVLVAIAAGALWLRLEYIWTLRDGRALGGDALYYHSSANLVAEGRGFVNPFSYVKYGRLDQSAEHPPLYVLYLAAFSWLGFRSIHDHMVASALLGVATVIIGGLAAREIGGRKLGVLTALLLAVYPNIWRHDGMVMSETAAIFTTVLTIWFAYRFWWNPTFRRALALGVAVALATTARSELALFAVFLVIPLVLWKRDNTFKQRAQWLGAAGLGFLLLLTPFLAFNYARFGKPTFLSAQLEVTLATANCQGTYAGDWKGYWDLSCAKAILKANDIDDPTDPRTPPLMLDAAKQYVGDHHDLIPGAVAARWGRLIGAYHNEQQIEVIDTYFEGGNASVARAGIWSLWIIGSASLVGAIALRVRRVPLTPLVGPIATVFVTVTLLYTATRFRAPADAALCFLAAAGLLALVQGAMWVVRRAGAHVGQS